MVIMTTSSREVFPRILNQVTSVSLYFYFFTRTEVEVCPCSFRHRFCGALSAQSITLKNMSASFVKLLYLMLNNHWRLLCALEHMGDALSHTYF